MSKPVLYARTMNAVGDCILVRPFVRDLAAKYELALQTPFPQLFTDIPIRKLVRAKSSLPHVVAAIREYGEHHEWRGAPKDKDSNPLTPIMLDYDVNDPTNVTDQLMRKFPLSGEYSLDVPLRDIPQLFHGARVAVIRPVVLRPEFDVPARNPRVEYIDMATRMLNDAGFMTVSIANGPNEYVHPLPTSVKFEKGQLRFDVMLSMIQNAKIVVSGAGFGMLLAAAARTPYLAAIWGGRGQLDNPHRIFHKKMNLERVTNFIPDPRCNDLTASCDCEKVIPDFKRSMRNLVDQVASTC